MRAIEQQMAPGTRRLLEEIAPVSIRLPRGRQVAVHYEPGQPPWIASRLQDFFGMRETPAVGRGAVPVVVRLLAPNQRPVQMTSDLAGFWQRLVPTGSQGTVAPIPEACVAGKPAIAVTAGYRATGGPLANARGSDWSPDIGCDFCYNY